jgi:hypothetical protein
LPVALGDRSCLLDRFTEFFRDAIMVVVGQGAQ